MANKVKIVLSDLHLGAGRSEEGNALEDFTSDQDFADLLDGLAADSDQSSTEVELILAGDIFEMLQVPHVRNFDPTLVYAPARYHSSSEPDSACKMDHIVAGHPVFFQALGRFIQSGPPRRSVTLVKGNHDLALHWPAVQDRVRHALGVGGNKTPLLQFEERRVGREGIYVEHGNQYGLFLDRAQNMEEPHDPDRPDQLALPPGSWFVMNVFNRIERDRYWVDGVKPITALIWYALAYDFEFAVWAIAELLRALPATMGDAFLDITGSTTDLIAHLENPDWRRELAARYQAEPNLRLELHARLGRVLGTIYGLGSGSARPTLAADPVAMGEHIRAQVRSSLYNAAAALAVEKGASVIVFGHTHEPAAETLPNGSTYLNTGTWTWSGDFAGASPSTWRELFRHPERFISERRLTYARIDYDRTGKPAASLIVHRGRPKPARLALLSLWHRLLALCREAGTRLSR